MKVLKAPVPFAPHLMFPEILVEWKATLVLGTHRRVSNNNVCNFGSLFYIRLAIIRPHEFQSGITRRTNQAAHHISCNISNL